MDKEQGAGIHVFFIVLLVVAVASGCATPAETRFINGQLIAEMARDQR